MNTPLSILIRTYNSAGTLAEVLTRLGARAEDEILVVDSGSTDRTLEIAAQYQAKIIRVEPPFNYSKSLNRGFAVARHDWVLVISSHCLPATPDLLAVFRQATTRCTRQTMVAYGECTVAAAPLAASAPLLTTDQTASQAQWMQIYGGNTLALYQRSAWEQQPFDETLPTGEDLDWFLKALKQGWSAARLPNACVLYRNQASLARMFYKGWIESRQIILQTGGKGMNLWQLAINWASLGKKWLKSQMPASALFRSAARALGAYLSLKFFSPPKKHQPPSSPAK